jgi:hypothetical protein
MQPPIQTIKDSQAEDLTNLFEFAPEMLAVLSVDGAFLRLNAASERTLPFSDSYILPTRKPPLEDS